MLLLLFLGIKRRSVKLRSKFNDSSRDVSEERAFIDTAALRLVKLCCVDGFSACPHISNSGARTDGHASVDAQKSQLQVWRNDRVTVCYLGCERLL